MLCFLVGSFELTISIIISSRVSISVDALLSPVYYESNQNSTETESFRTRKKNDLLCMLTGWLKSAEQKRIVRLTNK